MPVTSKTGLLPSIQKNVKKKDYFQENVPVEMPNFAKRAPFALKPFAGVYNPFPYGCSILCNHPADFEAKTIVKKAKDAWATEGKSLIDLEVSTLHSQEKSRQLETYNEQNEVCDETILEELFRKYTDTDSRPITPAPTLASMTTKASQNLKTRRCVTPDPTSFIPTKEKTLLVLDLRRSQSQDIMSWQGGQAADVVLDEDVQEAGTSRTTSLSSQSTFQSKKKKINKKKSIPTSATASTLKSENSRDSDSKTHTQVSSGYQSPSKESLILEPDEGKKHQISRESSSNDMDMVKRRGKKKKGKKTGKDGDKEFKGIQDPNETQVSALENDSKEGSRQSLSEDDNVEELKTQESRTANKEAEEDQGNDSFLKRDILKLLQRQLDQEVVDAELNPNRKIALEEALRLKTNPKHQQQGDEIKILKKEFQLPIKNSEKWLSIPRVFTRKSARFELPMDSRILNNLTPLQYVQNYVFASPERLVLYNHVFNLYKEEPEDDEEVERILIGKNVVKCLGNVMGRALTANEAKEFQNLLDWKDDALLDFRTFTGIGATCERLLSCRFCSKMPSQEEDPRHEVERADFETLDGKLLRLNPDRRLVNILKSVRDF